MDDGNEPWGSAAFVRLAQGAEAGELISVQMRIRCLDQIEIEFLHQLPIAVHFLQQSMMSASPPRRLARRYE